MVVARICVNLNKNTAKTAAFITQNSQILHISRIIAYYLYTGNATSCYASDVKCYSDCHVIVVAALSSALAYLILVNTD